MIKLEARYRRLFAAYPREVRARQEDEVVATLLDVAGPGQRRPGRREALAILGSGLAYRVRARPEWKAGLEIGGLLSLGLATAMAAAGLGVSLVPPNRGIDPLTPVAWLAALAAVWGCSCLRKVAARAAVGVAVAAGVVALGPAVMGPTRGDYLAPLALFALLATLSGPVPGRARVLVIGAGAAVAAVFVVSSVDAYHSVGWYPSGSVEGKITDRWNLVVANREMPGPHVWLLTMASGVVAGLFRSRWAVAAAVVCVPLRMITLGPFGSQDLDSLVLALGSLTLLGAIAAARGGRARAAWGPAGRSRCDAVGIRAGEPRC